MVGLMGGRASKCQSSIAIPIPNTSFEDPVVTPRDQCGGTYYRPAGWYTSGGNGGVIIRNVTSKPCDFSPTPYGQQMVMLYNSTISTNLGDVTSTLPRDSSGNVNGKWTLHFSVASYFYWYPGRYSASLSFIQPNGDITDLCTTSGWTTGDWEDLELVCASDRLGGQLVITLGSGKIGALYGWYQNLVDNVSLTFTPTN